MISSTSGVHSHLLYKISAQMDKKTKMQTDLFSGWFLLNTLNFSFNTLYCSLWKCCSSTAACQPAPHACQPARKLLLTKLFCRQFILPNWKSCIYKHRTALSSHTWILPSQTQMDLLSRRRCIATWTAEATRNRTVMKSHCNFANE